jgi:hypothetical protein
VVVPTFMEVLDTTIALVALRYIAGGLSATVDDGLWVITSYLAANAFILPITGWLSAHLGRRNYFLASIAIFTPSSLMCGLAGPGHLASRGLGRGALDLLCSGERGRLPLYARRVGRRRGRAVEFAAQRENKRRAAVRRPLVKYGAQVRSAGVRILYYIAPAYGKRTVCGAAHSECVWGSTERHSAPCLCSTPVVGLRDFAVWARSVEWDIPSELASLAGASAERPTSAPNPDPNERLTLPEQVRLLARVMPADRAKARIEKAFRFREIACQPQFAVSYLV